MARVTQLKDYAAKLLNTVDGWQSLISGMGVEGRDKTKSIRFVRNRRLTFVQLEALVRFDGLAKKIVNEIVEDAFKCGWKIGFPEAAGVDPEKINEINKRLEEWHKKTRFKQHLKRHLSQARGLGGSLLVLGVDDGQPLSEELQPDRLRTFDWVKPLDRYQVSPTGHIDTRPKSHFFGLPMWYHLTSMFGSTNFGEFFNGPGEKGNTVLGTQVGSSPTEATLNNVSVHASRLWRTDGVELTDRSRLENEGWGDSVLEAAYDPLKNWNSALAGSGTLIQDFAVGVYSIRGLRDILAANEEGLLQKRFGLMDYLKSTWNAVLIDAEGESYERKSITVTGLPELIDRHGIHLSSVVGMSLTKLFGVSPGGFGTGEAEGDNWDDRVGSYQDDDVRPPLEYSYGLLFKTKEFSDVPDGWVVAFEPLQLESQSETADTRLKVAQMDQIYHGMGGLHADEIVTSRFGGGKWSMETNLEADDETSEPSADVLAAAASRNAQALADPAPARTDVAVPVTAEVQKTALNGAQVSALTAMVQQVSSGEMPAASAISAALFGFPTMTEAEAKAMFEPAALAATENKAAKAAEAERVAIQMQQTPSEPPTSTGHNVPPKDEEE